MRSPTHRRWLRRLLATLVAGTALALVPAGAASAHPLGNFTVNTADRLMVTARGVDVTHVVDYAELPTVQLSRARAGVDTNGDGTLSQPELTAWSARACGTVAGQLSLNVDGPAVPLTVQSSAAAPRPGAAGLPTTRLTCNLHAAPRPRAQVAFDDPVARDRNGWREVTAGSQCGPLQGSDVATKSQTGLLAFYPKDLLSSPSDVSAATFGVQAGAPCGTAVGDAAGSKSTSPVQSELSRGNSGITQAFTDYLGQRDLTPLIAVLALLAATAFGVVHAVAPGHGKTVMAAYLVGQRGTRRQALQLGALVTFTHTVSVLALGALIVLAQFSAPELVVPFTEVLSGVLLAAVGVYLLVLARRRLQRSGLGGHDHSHGDGDHLHDHGPHDHEHGPHDHDHDHDHDHGPPGHEPARHDLADAPPFPQQLEPAVSGSTAVATRPPVHSHGGRAHSHAVPDGPLSWRTLAGMGLAGGLVPSPSALIVLLSATALGRAWFGVLLVVAYGVGMAITLTMAGLLLLRARAVLDRRGWTAGRRGARWARLLPLGTASIVVVLGLGLVLRGIITGRGLL